MAERSRCEDNGTVHIREDVLLYYFRREAAQFPDYYGATDMATRDELQFIDRMIATSEPLLEVENVYVSGIFSVLHDDAFYCQP